MDLYSAARRLTKPFRYTKEMDLWDSYAIADRGLIGDGFSAALVRPDGAIDWLCLPRFDSPSVFAGILDPDRGGLTAITPVSRNYESLQRYDPNTNVLETLFRVDGQGVVRITDFMPWTGDPRLSIHEVHRRVQCVEGEVDLRVVFDPRFDYGRDVPEMERHEHGVLARGAQGESLVAVVSRQPTWAPCEKGGVETQFRMRPGERRWMILSWDAPHPEPVAAYRPNQQLRTTRTRWREWASSLDYEGPWRHHVLRAGLVLKALIYAPSGAMVAAPTMALPELIGGGRNWDYRYFWSRDAAMSIRAANVIGFRHEAGNFFHFVRDILEDKDTLRVMYAVDGGYVPQEEVLAHLSGHKQSAPVNLGNGARDQVQLDTSGALLDAAYLYEAYGGSLTLRAWRSLRQVVENAVAQWAAPDHGIWEPRHGMRHNVHSKLMSWLCFRRGAQLAPLFGDQDARIRWDSEAAKVHAQLCGQGVDKTGRYFTAAYGAPEMDSALLLLPIHGFVPPTDPRVLGTIDRVRSELGEGSFLYRYRGEDGLEGDEGAFILCGFWLAEALAMAGQLEEAQEVFLAHAEASNHLGLLAEEIDPRSGMQLGNFPQAFSHLGLINAAVRIDHAQRVMEGDEVPKRAGFIA